MVAEERNMKGNRLGRQRRSAVARERTWIRTREGGSHQKHTGEGGGKGTVG